MTDLLQVSDLTPFGTIDADKAAAMIVDATAMATLAAPCLGDPDSLTDLQLSQAKAVLRGAVLRWNDTGSGVQQSQTMGPFAVSTDTRQARRMMFWPSEITALQKICVKDTDDGGVFSIDTAPACPMTVHPTFGGWHGWYGGSSGSGYGGWNDNGRPI